MCGAFEIMGGGAEQDDLILDIAGTLPALSVAKICFSCSLRAYLHRLSEDLGVGVVGFFLRGTSVAKLLISRLLRPGAWGYFTKTPELHLAA